jgi:uridylate kinase
MFIRTQLHCIPIASFWSWGEQLLGNIEMLVGKFSTELTEEDLDWLGIHATRLNAHLVRTIFQDLAHPNIIEHYEYIRKPSEPVIVAAGWKPGWSTDYCASLLCEDYHVRTVINLSNVQQVYDKDPNEYSDGNQLVR